MIVGKARIRPDLRIYAIGDIHGCLVEVKRLVAKIDTDVRRRPIKKHKIIFLGDYIDRGPQNSAVLTYLNRLSRGKRNTVFLRGNHDERFAMFLAAPEQTGEGFLKWGGASTAKNYGVSIKRGERYREFAKRLRKRVPKSHLNFLNRLKFSYVQDDYFFAHAGVRPNITLNKQSNHDLMWIRADFINHRKPYSKVVVHGHTVVEKPEVFQNRIGIDTGCYNSGYLTALVLEENTHRFIQTKTT